MCFVVGWALVLANFNLIFMVSIKRLFVLVTAAAVMVFANAVAFAGFTDVDSWNENYDAIMYVEENGIVGGYSDGSFDPYGEINRAELLKVLVIAREGADISDAQDGNCFGDISASAWYSKYVCYAKTQGYIDGYSDNTFRPDKPISFVEAAKMITVTLGYLVWPDEEIWYRTHVYALEERGAIPTTVNSFDIEMMRGEVAEIIYRLGAQISTKDTMTYDCLNGGDCSGFGDGGWDPGDLDVSGDGNGGWTADSAFSFWDMHTGDVVAGWTMSLMTHAGDSIGFGTDNVVFYFDGSATLTGFYDYTGDDQASMMSDVLCFDTLDEGSIGAMPWMMEDESGPENIWFCFDNQEEAKDMFGITSGVSQRGQATIVIEDFVLIYYPASMSNSTTLVEVVEME